MDKALKQRLTGAVILIALAIIFLPILLDGEQGSQTKSRIEIPQSPEMNFPTRRLPVGNHQQTAPLAEADVEPVFQPDEAVAEPSQVQLDSDKPSVAVDSNITITPLQPNPDPVPSQVDKAEDEPVALKETPVVLSATAGRWQIQVASFAGQKNAEKLVSRLRRTGYQARTETFSRDALTLHRVIVSAYQDRAEASLAANSIRKQIEGVSPKVLAPENVGADTIASPVAPTGRWSIQIGSFSKAENADNLVKKLKQSDYLAFKELSGSVHKVMVGPFIDRDRAEQQRDEISKKLKLKGILREQP